MYENGELENDTIITRHPNLILNVIQGKKGWGLWKREWAIGISCCDFTRYEILEEFKNNNIDIPEPFLIDFYNEIYKQITNDKKN